MIYLVGKNSGTTYALEPQALIGQGSEGRVYRVGKTCVKVFATALSPEQTDKIEALILLRRSLPGFAWPTEVVASPDSGLAVGFAMDLVAGESLETLLDARETAKIPVLTKVKLALDIARAVAVVHASRGPTIVLGDVIKAANLVCGPVAVFVDAAAASVFGFRVASGDVRDSVSSLSTPGYVPREVLENPHAIPSHSADMFAFAVLLFELLFGRSPHEPRPGPATVGLDPDDAVRRGIYPRWVKIPEYEAPSYDPVDLPEGVDELFRAAFLSSGVRPAASRWCEALESWLEQITPEPVPPPSGIGAALSAWLTVDRVLGILCVLLLATRAVFWAQQYFAGPPAPFVRPPLELPSPPPTPVGPDLFREFFR